LGPGCSLSPRSRRNVMNIHALLPVIALSADRFRFVLEFRDG